MAGVDVEGDFCLQDRDYIRTASRDALHLSFPS